MLRAFALVGAVVVTSGVAVLAASRAAPKPVDAEGRALYEVVRLAGATDEQVRLLVELGFDIEGRAGDEIVAYVSREERAKLSALGVRWRAAPELDPRRTTELAGGEAGTDAPAAYHTYDSLTADLQQVAADHAAIARLVSAGQSVQGRELWWLRISDNPDTPEDEPGFKFIGAIHGDEQVGTENCLRMIDLLTDSYGSDPRLTRLVDELEIWIMPLMNPDGHAVPQRYNAQGVDLNRDFPDRLDDPVNTGDGRAVETGLILGWQAAHTTALSANFHGGALVVNYPYDNNVEKLSVYTPTPDDDIIVDVSLEYSEDNAPMYGGSFPQGITNGADWYVVSGGMQDWNYDYHGDVDLTIELSDVKIPPANQLDGYWDDNRESMISLIERALTGLRGVVTDSETGGPLAATLEIAGRGAKFFADPAAGDYQRIMPAGSFDLAVSAAGYHSKSVPFTLADPEADAVRVDVQLDPRETAIDQAGARVAEDDDADGFLEAGETGRLAVSLSNDGRLATGVSGVLRALTPHGSPAAGATWPALGPGATEESAAPHLGIDVSASAPPGHKLGLAIDWQAAGGLSGTTSAFFVPLGAPSVVQEVATDVPKAITDNTTIESTLTVAEDLETDEINVRVDITHTYIGDLEVTLIAPDGTPVRLHDNGGGTTDDIHTWYDTETAPVDSLDVLEGMSSLGTWTLRVEDLGFGDTGTLDGWTLERSGRPWEDPVADVLLRSVAKEQGSGVTLAWWPVGSATSYRVYRSADPSSEAAFADVTAGDADPGDTLFADATLVAAGSALYWLVVAEGYTGEGMWGHFGR